MNSILFFTVVVLLTVLALLHSDGTVIINLPNYHIETSIYFSIFIFCCLFFIMLIIMRLPYILIKHKSNFKIKNYSKILENIITYLICRRNNAFLSVKLPDYLHKTKAAQLLQIETALRARNYESLLAELVTIKSVMNYQAQDLLKLLIYDKSGVYALYRLANLYPERPWALPFRVYYDCLRGDWQTVIMILERVSKQDLTVPFDIKLILSVCYFMIAQSYIERSQHSDALNLLRKANERYVFVVLLKAEIYQMLNKKNKALRVLTRCYEINPHPDIAKAYLAKNQNGASILIKLAPSYYYSQYIAALNHYNHKQYLECLDVLESAAQKVFFLSFYLLMLKNNPHIGSKNLIVKIIDVRLDPCWQCSCCNKRYESWIQECSRCRTFCGVEWIGEEDYKISYNFVLQTL